MQEIQLFQNPQFGEIRTVQINGEPWFVAKDIAESLGYVWNGIQRISHIPEEWRGVTTVVTPSGNQEMYVISEQGLYFFLNRSDKPSALPFQKWISGEILPSIRKHGGYLTNKTIEDIINDPDTIIRMAQTLKAEREKIKKLEEEKKEALPKIEFFNAVSDSETSLTFRDFGRILGIGQNTLFQKCRELKLIDSQNSPYQKYIDAGYFKEIEKAFQKKEKTLLYKQTLITGKGQIYIERKIKGANNE